MDWQNGRTLRNATLWTVLLSSERQKSDVIALNNESKLDDHRATNRSKKRWGGRNRKWIARVTRFVHVHSFCLLLLLLYCPPFTWTQQIHSNTFSLWHSCVAGCCHRCLKRSNCICIEILFTVVLVPAKPKCQCICVKFGFVCMYWFVLANAAELVPVCVCLC